MVYMKALILAAGTGTRLLPMNAGRPKAMLEIKGLPLVNHLIRALLAHEICDITIVVGYQYSMLTNYILEAFPGKRFSFVYNPLFRHMNNIFSFHLCQPYVSGSELLVCNSDVYCAPDLLVDILSAPFDTMVVDTQKEYTLEATKVIFNALGAISKISKDIPREQNQGEYIGICKLSGTSTDLLFNAVRENLDQGKTELWYIYVLDQLLNQIAVRPFFTEGRVWEEIDYPADYFNLLHQLERLA